MRLVIAALVHILLILPFTTFAASTPGTTTEKNFSESPLLMRQKASAIKSYGRLPLYFIQNNGQVDKGVSFYEKGAGHATFFTDNGVVISLTKSNKKAVTPEGIKKLKRLRPEKASTDVVRLSFVGANKKAEITSSAELTGRVNYFRGNDKTKWQSNIPTFGKVTYNKVYKNIDVKFYGTNSNIEHDIIVHPGGDYREVKFAYDGVKGLKLNTKGDLEVSLSSGKITEKRPIVYQVVNGKKVFIDGSYMILSNNSYSYKVASFDGTRDLVIDPILVYSTYLGGSAYDVGYDITVDHTGAAYITGTTTSLNFPIKAPIQYTHGGGNTDAFITKINRAGTAIVYSTYVGGIGLEGGKAIAVDSLGSVYVAGETGSSWDFPLVNPLQRIYGGNTSDAFLLKLSPSGSAIIYSTYLGGSLSEFGNGVATDSTGAAYVTGSTTSSDFPTLNPIQNRTSKYFNYTFVTKVNPAGSALVYSTYVGGSKGSDSSDIAVDATGAAYVTGITYSTDFPLINPLQGTFAGGSIDAFITKINPAGTAYIYSTYLGGGGPEWARSIAIDRSGSVYLTGEVLTPDFPLVNSLQGFGGVADAFVTKINAAGSAIVYSTFIGGSSTDDGVGIAVDEAGAAYVTGWTTSTTDFPLVSPFQGVHGAVNSEVFMTKINPSGSAIVFSSYLGGNNFEGAEGIAVDNSGAAYITGFTASTDFPLAKPIHLHHSGGGGDAFISKISPPVIALTINMGNISVVRGSTLSYDVSVINTTSKRQCFQYWENVTLPGGKQFPATGELKGPIRLCLNGKATMVKRLNLHVPAGVPLGTYTLNAFIGAYEFPVNPVLVSEDHFTFGITAF